MSSKSKKQITPATAKADKAQATPKANWLDANKVTPQFDIVVKLDKQACAMAHIALCQAVNLNPLGIDTLAGFAAITAGYVNGKQAVTSDAKSGNRIYIVHGLANKPWTQAAIGKLAACNGKATAAIAAVASYVCRIAKINPAQLRQAVAKLADKNGNKSNAKACSVALQSASKIAA